MSNVKLIDVKKSYDKSSTLAVDDFNLEIADKEFVVFVGPSGCGKSTTLRMIAGLEDITSGSIFIDDRLVNDVLPKDRDIAMVFQNYALYPHMTVYENMAFSLKMRKIPKDEINERVERAAEILDITEFLPRRPKALSGGQKQRVAIGRAIVRNPKVFLMDEPLSNLDAKLRNQMRAELITLRQRVDTTFIYVTHDQTEAMTLGDRIVIMKDGLIQQVGTPQEVFESPVNMFVAGFIGSPQMNFFPAHLDMNRGSVDMFDHTFDLSPERMEILQQNKAVSQKVVCGIRPEYLLVGKQDDINSIKATIDVSEVMGSCAYVHVKILESEAILVVNLTDSFKDNANRFKSGEAINITFDENRMHLFDENEENMCLDL